MTDLSQVQDLAYEQPESPASSHFSPMTSPGPNGITSPVSPGRQTTISIAPAPASILNRRNMGPTSPDTLPPPVSVGSPGKRTSFMHTIMSPISNRNMAKDHDRMILQKTDEAYLMPASIPPKYSLFDLFPFSLLVAFLTKRGKDVKGKRGAKMRAKFKNEAISHNLPLELSLYLVG